MAKGQPFILVKDIRGYLSAHDAWTDERLSLLPIATPLKVERIVLPRKLPFQGLYWVVLTNIVRATEVAATAKHLHHALLKLTGYAAPIHNAQGDVIDWAVDSTSFEAMDQIAFETYVRHAQKALAEHIGINWDDFAQRRAA